MEVSGFVVLVLNHSVILLIAHEQNTTACFFLFLLIVFLLPQDNHLVNFVSLSYHNHQLRTLYCSISSIISFHFSFFLRNT
jgi:hypothetical protein